MQIPENLSEQEVVDVILKVCKKLAPKYVFASYEVEDIEQEAFMMGVEALNRYDSDKPLENFIYAHINKKSILEPVDIAALYSLSTDDNIVDEAHLSEVLDLIDRKLPADLRGDYLKLRTNSPLPKGRKAMIIQAIEDIIDPNQEDE